MMLLRFLPTCQRSAPRYFALAIADFLPTGLRPNVIKLSIYDVGIEVPPPAAIGMTVRFWGYPVRFLASLEMQTGRVFRAKREILLDIKKGPVIPTSVSEEEPQLLPYYLLNLMTVGSAP